MPETSDNAYSNYNNSKNKGAEEPVDEDFWYESEEESFDEESLMDENMDDQFEDDDEEERTTRMKIWVENNPTNIH